MKRAWVLLLILSLGINGWLGYREYQQRRKIDQGAAYLTWHVDYGLNGLAQLMNDPATDWKSPAFQADVLRLLERARVNAEAAGSTMAGLTTGEQALVMGQLNRLTFVLPSYETIALRLLSGTAKEGELYRLQRFGTNLKQAGWPRKPISRDSEADWAGLSAALETFLGAEGK